MEGKTDPRIGSMEVPRKNGELVFAAPWEARAFGMAVALNTEGRYEWREFSARLAERDGDASTYYQRWLAALEELALARGLITREELQERLHALNAEDDHHDHDH